MSYNQGQQQPIATAAKERPEIQRLLDALDCRITQLDETAHRLGERIVPVMAAPIPTGVASPSPAPQCTGLGQVLHTLDMRLADINCYLNELTDRVAL